MKLRVLRPFPEGLSVKPEDDCSHAKGYLQSQVRHYWCHEADLSDPVCDELRKTPAPHIFVDGDGNKYGTCYRFVRVDCVSGSYRRESCSLNTDASVAKDDNNLVKSEYFLLCTLLNTYCPVPGSLIADGNDNVSNNHQDCIRYDSQ